MNVSMLTKLVLTKFYEANGYSDISKEELTESITNYLEDEYHKRVWKSTEIIKKEENITGFANLKRYEEEHEKIEKEIVFIARSLAATSMEDLQDLVESS
jgi:hypothetical protein